MLTEIKHKKCKLILICCTKIAKTEITLIKNYIEYMKLTNENDKHTKKIQKLSNGKQK